ncbi:MAG: tetratricopeptide repeat protein [Gammaproteobacteria bacterium]|nr:tetratricopeptide repeat protein [Gammaproteobacteria bacterium]MDH5239560.1 tetratricopeptide repeat protein [Gammaproteobacteria bacterium]MDH5260906.1 tetratricopeptide repeat protein [Gammaproteobacteria bacterium]MDH5583230.1 tetratricopeptide repeat protein [Gammaproteobacteria bacterium]
MSFFAELKRRNVFRVAVAYSVIAWILAQVADLAFDNFGSPEWVSKTVLFILVLGLPLAVFFAWAFELTPEGLKKEKDVDRSQSITPQTGRKLDLTIIGVLVIGIGFLMFDRFTGDDDSAAVEVVKTDSARLSIAVLPFENRSDRPEDEYFTEGIHDDLLTTMANIGSMKVISRTSVMEYKETTKKIPEIAKELGVANILEGGIQRSGNHVRINVQLIDAITDEHLWAEIYDRELTAENLFAIQSEVSNAIAKALNATLSPQEVQRVSSIPTQSLEAYEAYLLGRQKWSARTAASTAEAVTLFQKAIDLDPDYAQAYAGLADAYRHQVPYGGLPEAEALPKAERAVRKALVLDDQLAEGYATLGGLLAQQNRDLAEAEAALKRALELNPAYSDAYNWLALTYQASGEFEKAQTVVRKGLEVDPLSLVLQLNLGLNLGALGRTDEMRAAVERLIEVAPESAFGYMGMSFYSGFYKGRIDDSILWLNKATELEKNDPAFASYMSYWYLDLNDTRMADYWVTRASDIRPDNVNVYSAKMMTALHSGDPDVARTLALAAIDASRSAVFNFPVLFESLRGDIADNSLHLSIQRIETVAPELFHTDAASVSSANLAVALALAKLQRELGNETRAKQILSDAINLLQAQGTTGAIVPGPELAIAHSLTGDYAKAMTALRAATNAGWRYGWWYVFDHLDLLEPLRSEPAFGALRAEIAEDMAEQLKNVRKMEASGQVESPSTIPALKSPPPT